MNLCETLGWSRTRPKPILPRALETDIREMAEEASPMVRPVVIGQLWEVLCSVISGQKLILFRALVMAFGEMVKSLPIPVA